MRQRFSIILLAIAMGWAGTAPAAEVAYVTDMLQLGLHRAPDTSDRPFTNLTSGTRLEVLERSAQYARVREPGGSEGWVKSAFIVAEVPARFRLDELEAEVAALRADLMAARSTERRAVNEAERLRAAKDAAAESAESLRDAVARLEQDNAGLIERFGANRLMLPIGWVLAALIVAFAGGGGTAWWAIDAMSRRRHAGYRVY